MLIQTYEHHGCITVLICNKLKRHVCRVIIQAPPSLVYMLSRHQLYHADTEKHFGIIGSLHK